MSAYTLQGKKADGQMVDIPLAAQYDGDGRDISATYATKTELAQLGTFDPSGSYPSLTAGNATEAASADKADADGAGNNIQTTYATKAEVGAKADQSALEDVVDGTTPVAKASTADSATAATKATQDGSGNVIATTYATKTEVGAKADQSDLDDVIDGTTPVAKATSADTATSAGSATNADHATTADSATTAATADSATKATQDGDGNVISTTYAKSTDVQNTVQQLQNGTFVVGKAASATTADSATNATNATNAQKAMADAAGNTISATYATKSELAAAGQFDPNGTYPNLTAGNATHAASADAATKASQDGNGNNIASTYATKSEVTKLKKYTHNITVIRLNGSEGDNKDSFVMQWKSDSATPINSFSSLFNILKNAGFYRENSVAGGTSGTWAENQYLIKLNNGSINAVTDGFICAIKDEYRSYIYYGPGNQFQSDVTSVMLITDVVLEN